MKVERVREKDGKLELMAELSGAEVAQELNEIAQAEIAKNEYDFDYNGDQSAVAFLRERLGNDEAAFVLDEALMRKRASFALTAAQVDIIGSPVYRCLEHATEGKPFEYHMVVVLVPEMELESYDPVSITVPSYTVKKDEVDEEIERMVKASSINVTDETHETVVKGDKVELKLYTTMDGKKVRPLCTEGRQYSTGSQTMPDDFDEAIIGMKVGETKTFTFLGPDTVLNEDGTPKMDEYECTATVNRILTSQAPTLNDGWAATVRMGVKTMEELREVVAKEIQEKHDDEYRRLAENLAGNELAKRLIGKIPDLVYGVAVKEAKENLVKNLKDQGMTVEEYLEKEGQSEQQLNQQIMLNIRQQLTRQFALNAFAKHRGLIAEEDDMNAYFESIAPGKANFAHRDFKKDGRMYAARCAATRLKAARIVVQEANVKKLGE
ncbi:MAG: trigger factor [Eggerthellales bacterium]|nr:trigger factor [Eggerthellales bacterium]